MILYVSCFLVMIIESATSLQTQGGPRQNLLRLARDDKSPRPPLDFSGAEVVRTLLIGRSLDRLGGGEVLRLLDPLTHGKMMRAVDQMTAGPALDNFRGGEVLRVLDRLTGGDLIGSLESVDGVTVLHALELSRQSRHPKRTLDTLTGMAFGESKRFDSLSGSTFGLSKRDFDEIDNVGFTGFAKRGGSYKGGSSLALAKKNFDEIDRAGFEGYDKRNFDEIDRAGFETFEKRGKE